MILSNIKIKKNGNLLFIGPKSTIGSQLIKKLSTEYNLVKLRLSEINNQQIEKEIHEYITKKQIKYCVISTRVRTANIEEAINGETIIIDKIIKYLCSNKKCKSIVILGSVTGERIDSSSTLAYHLTKSFLDVISRFYAVTQGNTRINMITLYHVDKYKNKDEKIKEFI